jgi:hypothetical protein
MTGNLVGFRSSAGALARAGLLTTFERHKRDAVSRPE